MKRKHRLANLSLQKKLVLLFALAGIIPLAITFFATYGELRESVISRQSYTANQSFEQALSLLQAKFNHLEDISSMIMVDEQINEVFSKDPRDMEIWEQLADFERITTYTRILQANSDLSEILYYIDGGFVTAGARSKIYRPLEDVASQDWVRKIMAAQGEAVWVLAQDEAVPSRTYLILGRVLWDINDYSTPVGIVALRLEPERLQSYVMNTVAEQLIYLETDDGEIVISNGQGGLEQRQQWFAGHAERDGFDSVYANGKEYLIRNASIAPPYLYLYSVIPGNVAAQAVNQVRNQVLLVYAVVCLALLACIFPVTKSITRRIRLLMNKMSQVRQGRLSTLDIPPLEDEVGHLVSSYNYMINSVKELMETQYRLGQEIKGAELRALQSQINPHFLYNTLDMIVWMTNKDEKEHIQRAVYALSDYYKLILNKGEDFVTLKDELKLCEKYVAIQQLRFKGKIRFDIEVEDSARLCLLPKISLQPLVENAILHGILEKPEGEGVIAIRGGIHSDRLRLAVHDDGPGSSTEEMENRTHRPRGSGYGLSNIRRRLVYYFNESARLVLESEQGRGTTVCLDVPAIRKQDRVSDGHGDENDERSR